MTMLFGKSKAAAKPSKETFKVGQTANKGTYVPDGLTAEQYAKQLAAEAKAKAQKQSKFPKGRVTLSLTEWMEQEKKKGYEGKDLLLKGHRMVKAKYDEFYTDISPV